MTISCCGAPARAQRAAAGRRASGRPGRLVILGRRARAARRTAGRCHASRRRTARPSRARRVLRGQSKRAVARAGRRRFVPVRRRRDAGAEHGHEPAARAARARLATVLACAGRRPAARSSGSWRRIGAWSCCSAGPGSIPSSSTSPAGVLVGLERVGLPARPVEREHQLAAEPLAQRVLARPAPRARRRLGRCRRARARRRSAPRAPPAAAPRAGRSRSARTARTAKSASGGPRQSASASPSRPRALGVRPTAPRPTQLLEAAEVELRPGRRRGRSPARASRATSAPSSLPQLRDRVLERGPRGLRRLLAPQLVDQPLGRDRPRSRRSRRSASSDALLAAADRDRVAVAGTSSGPRIRKSSTADGSNTGRGAWKGAD